MKPDGFRRGKFRGHLLFIAVLVISGVTSSMISFDILQQAAGFPVSRLPDVVLTAGRIPHEVNIIDLNQDQLPDILTVNDDGNDLSFFYQRADRHFNSTPDFSPYIGETPASAAIEDFNRDGLHDIVVVDRACYPYALNCNMTVFYQRPDHSYPLVPDQVVGRDDIVPEKIAAGDYNSDGLLDVAMSGGLGGRIFMYLQLPAGGFPDAPDSILWTPDSQSFGLTGADLNGDGLDDLALANHNSMTVSLYYQRGGSNILPIYPDVNLTSGDGPTNVIAGDLNADGLTDLVVTNGQEHTFSIFYQGRDYFFPATPDIKIGTGGTGNFVPYDAAMGDLNNDGLTDIVVTRATKDVAHVYLQVAGGGFASTSSFTLDARGSEAAAVGDLNGDGLDDIAISIYQTPDVGPNVYLYYQENPGLAPTTTLLVGDPQVGGPLTLVTSSTHLSFDAVDRSGAGIASTYYRINNGSWATYAQGTTFNLSVEGVNTIDFYSVDNASNIEPTSKEILGVDDTPPLTTISFGDPHFQSSKTWISPATNISLLATDSPSPAAGVNETSYRTWNASGWSPWLAYSAHFRVDSDGANAVQFRSTDRLDNIEPPQTVNMEVDGTPPFSLLEAPFIANGSRALTISAIDAGVGVAHTHFSADSGLWQYFTGVVYLSAGVDHQVSFYSDDLLMNIEAERSAFLPKAAPGPLTSLQAGTPSHGTLPVFLTSSTPLSLVAQDRSGSGVNRTEYSIDSGPWRNYSLSFTLSGEGIHEVSFYSVDNLGQQGPTDTSILVVDDSGPETSLLSGAGAHVARDGERFATSSSTFILDAEDNGALPVGVGDVESQVWTSSGWSDWTPFSAPFSLGQPEGIRWVRYYATDLLGNQGAVRNESVLVDDTPPQSTLVISHPYYEDGQRFVTSSTPLYFSSSDGGATPVGMNATLYRTWDDGWTTWHEYRSPFRAAGGDGIRFVEFYSKDLLGNGETAGNATLFVDNTPPATTLLPATGPFTTDTLFVLTATDAGSGVNVTRYRIDGGGWTDYATGFALSEGSHNISFMSMDNLGNREAERWRDVTIERMPAPHGPIEIVVNHKPLVAAVFAIFLVVAGLWSSRRRPWKGEKGGMAVVKAFAITSLPFVLAEAATGVTSFVTGELRIPPAVGAGTIVDVTILVVGMVAASLRIMEAKTFAE